MQMHRGTVRFVPTESGEPKAYELACVVSLR